MNEVLVLDRLGDPDDGMFSCHTGTIDGNGVKSIATFGEQRRAGDLVGSFLRHSNKPVQAYASTEFVIDEFLDYLREVTIK